MRYVVFEIFTMLQIHVVTLRVTTPYAVVDG